MWNPRQTWQKYARTGTRSRPDRACNVRIARVA
jgi:hypothetical protein